MKSLLVRAADAAKAITLSDEDVAKMAREYIQWMDTHNEVAGPDTEMGQRLANLTKDVKVDGLDLNFKVYNVIDVNAFACGDGSVRVCGGLMKIMDDNEVMAVIGHEIGDFARLVFAEHFARASNLEVVHGEVEAAAEILEGLKPLNIVSYPFGSILIN